MKTENGGLSQEDEYWKMLDEAVSAQPLSVYMDKPDSQKPAYRAALTQAAKITQLLLFMPSGTMADAYKLLQVVLERMTKHLPSGKNREVNTSGKQFRRDWEDIGWIVSGDVNGLQYRQAIEKERLDKERKWKQDKDGQIVEDNSAYLSTDDWEWDRFQHGKHEHRPIERRPITFQENMLVVRPDQIQGKIMINEVAPPLPLVNKTNNQQN